MNGVHENIDIDLFNFVGIDSNQRKVRLIFLDQLNSSQLVADQQERLFEHDVEVAFLQIQIFWRGEIEQPFDDRIGAADGGLHVVEHHFCIALLRSEERRVGKE